MFPQLRILGLALVGAGAFGSTAFAIATLEHGRLVGSATARVDYDSNIFATHSEVSDTIATGDANVSYLHDAGIVTADTTAGVTSLVFAQHSDQNTVDPYANAN